MIGQDPQESDKSQNSDALLELSAQEVQTLMQRFGVRSRRCAALLEAMDTLVALQDDLKSVVPAPQFVSLTSQSVH